MWRSLFLSMSLTTVGSAKPFVVAAIGDSITTGFNADRILDQRRVSWATGGSFFVQSHATRFANISGQTVKAYNVARAGAKSSDLPRQVLSLIGRDIVPDYVTMLIGANDICSYPENWREAKAVAKASIEVALNYITSVNPRVRIRALTTPNLEYLWRLGRQSHCQRRWDRLGFCSRLLGSESTDEDRRAVIARMGEFNELVRQIADQYQDNVSLTQVVNQTKFRPWHISQIDCFHPSIAGQAYLSELTWDRDFAISALEAGNF